MSIQAVSAGVNTYSAPKMKKVNFGESPAQQPQQTQEAPKKEGSWGKAIASLILPGLGQFFDGRNKDGFKQLGAFTGLTVLSGALYTRGMAAKGKFGQIAGIASGLISGFAALGTSIYSIVDAYKGGKKD